MIEFDARYLVEFAEETVYSYFKWKFHRLPVLEEIMIFLTIDSITNDTRESIAGLDVENAGGERYDAIYRLFRLATESRL